MTREEAIDLLDNLIGAIEDNHGSDYDEALKIAIKALEQEPCEDAISRQAVLKTISELNAISFYEAQKDSKECYYEIRQAIENEPPITLQPKIGHCKDCKWWKDSDGIFRRGIDAESQCPMNRKEVFEGDGYCYMFEPQKSEG